MTTINAKVQIRHDTAQNLKNANPVLLSGEQCYETDTGKMKIGDGSTTYNSLDYFGDSNDLGLSVVDGLLCVTYEEV